MTVQGGTSTGSKRPELLFGTTDGVPTRMVKTEGCHGWDVSGRAYVDMIMALGAVGLGYGHPAVTEAVLEAVRAGVVGSLPPTLEDEVASALCATLRGVERVLFCKTGAEAVAAAVRIARAATGRERVVTCGYHGWHDWCQDDAAVPQEVRALRTTVPFDDVEALKNAITSAPPPAALVLEPVVDGPPSRDWLEAARSATENTGTVLVFDEIKTGFRLAPGGAAERWGVTPDLTVVGKALANGFPLAMVGGAAGVMEAASQTWISSTLATESVSLAAAKAVLEVHRSSQVCTHLAVVGLRLYEGLERAARQHPDLVARVAGVPEMCYLRFHRETDGSAVARGMAARGVLFKRNAYNFVSFAHEMTVIDDVLTALDETLAATEGGC